MRLRLTNLILTVTLALLLIVGVGEWGRMMTDNPHAERVAQLLSERN